MEVTLNDLKEIILGSKKEDDPCLWRVGEKYFILTVTMIQVGRLKAVTDKELLLEDASWIPDTGRFHDVLKDGKFNEVEPFTDDVIVGRMAVIHAQVVSFDLPKTQI